VERVGHAVVRANSQHTQTYASEIQEHHARAERGCCKAMRPAVRADERTGADQGTRGSCRAQYGRQLAAWNQATTHGAAKRYVLSDGAAAGRVNQM